VPYLDKHGAQIDHARWAALCRNAKYARIADVHLPEQHARVTALWVGTWLPAVGTKPLIFAVSCVFMDSPLRVPPPVRWTETEEEALAEVDLLVSWLAGGKPRTTG